MKVVHPVAAPWVGPHLRPITRANSDVSGSSKKVGQEQPPWATVAQQMRENLRQKQQEGNSKKLSLLLVMQLLIGQ